jgi:hypothetical protein
MNHGYQSETAIQLRHSVALNIPPNKSLDESGTSGHVIDKFSILSLIFAANTPPVRP